MKFLFFILFLTTICWASSQFNQNRLENVLNKLKIFPGEKLVEHFKYLQAKVVPITNDCYNTTLNANGDKTNIFKENLRDVIRKYFKVFPRSLVGLSDEKYFKRVSTLVNSLAEFVEKVYKCENIKNKSTRQQGQLCLTSVSSLSSAELSGFSNPNLISKFFQHRINVPDSELCFLNALNNEEQPPTELNWNSKGYVTPPRYQGDDCNTCFIFSTVAAAESAWYRFKGKPTGEKFSEQAILNCMYEGKPAIEDPCRDAKGGLPSLVLEHMMEHGLTLAENEPYVNKTGHCENYPVAAKPVSYCRGDNVDDESLKRQLFRNGPLIIRIDINNLGNVCAGQSYKGPCPKESFHSVLLVGYDEEFWYFKNSWGDDWADKGFFKMSRDSKLCEECSIYSEFEVPLFKM